MAGGTSVRPQLLKQVVVPLAKVLNEHPNFRPAWKPFYETLRDGTQVLTAIDDPKHGRVELVVICRTEDGKPLWDQPIQIEGPTRGDGTRAPTQGAVVVPYFLKGDILHVGMLYRGREVVIDPKTGHQGVMSFELPRGFGQLGETGEDSALRELGEETGRVAKKITKIGEYLNPNDAFFATGTSVYAIELHETITSSLAPDSNEIILKCEFPPYSEVLDAAGIGGVFCGWTMSGFKFFDLYLDRLAGITPRARIAEIAAAISRMQGV